MGFFDTFALKSWFVEGLAVSCGGPKNFPDKEFYQVYFGTALFYDYDFNDLYVNLPKHNQQFRYALYGRFIDYLILTQGSSVLQDFLKAYMSNPREIKRVFRDIFNREPGELLKGFEDELEVEYHKP